MARAATGLREARQTFSLPTPICSPHHRCGDFICVLVSQSLCLYQSLSLFPSLSLCLSLSLCVSGCLFVCIFVCLFVGLCLSVSLSLHVLLCLSVCLPVCVSVCLPARARLSARVAASGSACLLFGHQFRTSRAAARTEGPARFTDISRKCRGEAERVDRQESSEGGSRGVRRIGEVHACHGRVLRANGRRGAMQ